MGVLQIFLGRTCRFSKRSLVHTLKYFFFKKRSNRISLQVPQKNNHKNHRPNNFEKLKNILNTLKYFFFKKRSCRE